MSENLSEYTPPEGYVRTTVGELRRVSRLPHPDMLVPVGKLVIGPLSDDAAAWVPKLCAEWWGVEIVDESSLDPLFDPEAEGWEPRKTGTGGGTYYDKPRPSALTFVTIPATGLTALLDLSDGITLYHGKHPTRSLVMAIIEQNGGDA